LYSRCPSSEHTNKEEHSIDSRQNGGRVKLTEEKNSREIKKQLKRGGQGGELPELSQGIPIIHKLQSNSMKTFTSDHR